MTTPPTIDPPNETPNTPDEPEADSRSRRRRIIVWAVLGLGSLTYLLVGQVSAISYRYSVFQQQTFREVESRNLVQIWEDQVRNLPSASLQWLLDVGFVISAIVVVTGVVYGAWLLMVSSATDSSADPATRMSRQRSR